MKLSEITEAGKYWAIDKDRKHHAFEIIMTIAGAVPKGLPLGLKIVSYRKMSLPSEESHYQPRKKLN